MYGFSGCKYLLSIGPEVHGTAVSLADFLGATTSETTALDKRRRRFLIQN